MDRTPAPSDIHAAQRGLNMLGMPLAELRELLAQHSGKPAFASRVIAMGAMQMIAVKKRNGAEE